MGLLGVFLAVLTMFAGCYVPIAKFFPNCPVTPKSEEVTDKTKTTDVGTVQPSNTQDILGNCQTGTDAWKAIQKNHKDNITALIDNILQGYEFTISTKENAKGAKDKRVQLEILDWDKVSNVLFQYIIAVKCRNTVTKCYPPLTTEAVESTDNVKKSQNELNEFRNMVIVRWIIEHDPKLITTPLECNDPT